MGVKTFAQPSDPDMHTEFQIQSSEKGVQGMLKWKAENEFPTRKRKADAIAYAGMR